MGFSGNNRRILRVKVVDGTIHYIENKDDPKSIKEGFIMGQELIRTEDGSVDDGNTIENQLVPPNQASSLKWKILLPHDIVNGTSTQPSPPYQAGDIIYAVKLDMPIIIKDSSLLADQNTLNEHPSVDNTRGYIQMIHETAFKDYFGGSIDAEKNVIFWLDLNVDGGTRGGGSGGGSASVVWL